MGKSGASSLNPKAGYSKVHTSSASAKVKPKATAKATAMAGDENWEMF
jgi:hypothetical protein